MAGDGIFFVLVGPSGAGKNTLIERLREQRPDLKQVATMTTRPMRDDEEEGVHHRFVSHARFQQAVDRRELVEWQRVHGSDLYGTPRDVVDAAIANGTELIADIEFLGAERLRDAYPDHTALIFVTPSNLRILAERIMRRGDISPEELAGRLNRARFEMTFAPACRYLVINDNREQAVDELRTVVTAEEARRGAAGLPAPGEHVTRHQIDAYVTALIQRNGDLLLRQGELPRFGLEAPGVRLDRAANAHVEALLGVPLRLIGPQDERFDYPAPSHVTVRGAAPYFALEYYYRFVYPPADHPLPEGWAWAPLAAVELPDMLSEVVIP